MGKSRRRKSVGFRSNPIVKAVKPLADPDLLALRDSKVLPVLQDLRSPDAKRRGAAAAAVANIVHDEKCRKLLLREQVVPIVLTETLTDSSIESRAAGWEILKELVLAEESDFCVHLFRVDVLTAVEHASSMILESGTSSALTKAHQRFVWDIAVSLVCILGALGRAGEEILFAIAKNATIARFLVVLSTSDNVDAELLAETLTCLLILTENGSDLIEGLIKFDQTALLGALQKLQSRVDVRASLACGIQHNIILFFRRKEQDPNIHTLADAFLVSKLAQIVDETARIQPTESDVPAEHIDTLQFALDILASIAADQRELLGLQSPVDEPEWDGIGDDEDMDEIPGPDAAQQNNIAAEADEDMPTPAVSADDEMNNVTSSFQSSDVMRNLAEKAVPSIVHLARTCAIEEDDMEMFKAALSALNDIAWALSNLESPTHEGMSISDIWSPVASDVWAKIISPTLAKDTSDLELADLVTSLAWAVSRNLKGNTPSMSDEYRQFITLYRVSGSLRNAGDAPVDEPEDSDPFDSISVKCIGVLGELARHPAPITMNREIGVFLLTILQGLPQTPAADAIEALDHLFDMYGDEDLPCDREVFWRDNFLGHLEEITPKFKSLAKSIKKNESPEMRRRADEASWNLGRFLQYKRKHKPEDPVSSALMEV